MPNRSAPRAPPLSARHGAAIHAAMFRIPALLLLAASALCAQDPNVLVYGATPAGIAAAIASAEDGEKVLLVEPTDRIGGMITCGLSHTDFRTVEGLTGAYLQFTKRVEQH